MTNYCVVAVDATRARFFVLDGTGTTQHTSGPHLREVVCLLNPDLTVPERDMFSSVHSGCNQGPAGQVHGYDDHRERHEQAFARRFAGEVSRKCAEVIQQKGVKQLVLTAEAHMLGMLRRDEPKLTRLGAEVHDIALDLATLSTDDIQSVLARHELLPASVPLRR